MCRRLRQWAGQGRLGQRTSLFLNWWSRVDEYQRKNGRKVSACPLLDSAHLYSEVTSKEISIFHEERACTWKNIALKTTSNSTHCYAFYFPPGRDSTQYAVMGIISQNIIWYCKSVFGEPRKKSVVLGLLQNPCMIACKYFEEKM